MVWLVYNLGNSYTTYRHQGYTNTHHTSSISIDADINTVDQYIGTPLGMGKSIALYGLDNRNIALVHLYITSNLVPVLIYE